MARIWKVKLHGSDGQVWVCYIHDDGNWEQDPNLPQIPYVELASLITRLNLAAAQFTRIGWDGGEIEREQ